MLVLLVGGWGSIRPPSRQGQRMTASPARPEMRNPCRIYRNPTSEIPSRPAGRGLGLIARSIRPHRAGAPANDGEPSAAWNAKPVPNLPTSDIRHPKSFGSLTAPGSVWVSLSGCSRCLSAWELTPPDRNEPQFHEESHPA